MKLSFAVTSKCFNSKPSLFELFFSCSVLQTVTVSLTGEKKLIWPRWITNTAVPNDIWSWPPNQTSLAVDSCENRRWLYFHPKIFLLHQLTAPGLKLNRFSAISSRWKEGLTYILANSNLRIPKFCELLWISYCVCCKIVNETFTALSANTWYNRNGKRLAGRFLKCLIGSTARHFRPWSDWDLCIDATGTFASVILLYNISETRVHAKWACRALVTIPNYANTWNPPHGLPS